LLHARLLAKPSVHCMMQKRGGMQGKIALEEHFAIGPHWAIAGIRLACLELKSSLLDIRTRREMDKHGVEIDLSLNARLFSDS
jgi:hypothetical protein